MTTCGLCNEKKRKSESGLCDKCKLTIFQITESLELYLKNKNPPKWLLTFLRDLGWIYQFFPKTKPYFDVAHEVTSEFVLLRNEQMSTDEVKRLAYANVPRHKIIGILERAGIVKISSNGEVLYPGKLCERLREIRWEGYKINSPQFQKRNMERNGILTIALTKSLLSEGEFTPRKALSLFHLLSLHMQFCDEKITKSIVPFVQKKAFRSLPESVLYGVKTQMTGWVDGQTKLLDDLDENENILLKDEIVEYAEQMRERHRNRTRSRS